jgi:integrase
MGKKLLHKIDNRALDTYQATRRQSGVSAGTVNKEIEILIYILRKAKVWKRLEDDYVPLPVSRNSPRRALDVEELTALVKAGLGNHDWEPALMAAIVAANTTCRSWEVKSLRIGDVDLVVPNFVPTTKPYRVLRSIRVPPRDRRKPLLDKASMAFGHSL